jgi:ubiquinone biosynthesis protein
MADRKRSSKKSLPRAIALESGRVGVAVVRHGFFGVPYALSRSLLFDASIDNVRDPGRRRELLGKSFLKLFDDLGPVYGKAGQIFLSRLSGKGMEIAESLDLTRLYGRWIPLEFDEIAEILDREIPSWRHELKVDPIPIGVASMAQVHACSDENGNEWVLKILKPNACKRLTETVDLLEGLMTAMDQVAATHSARTLVRDMRDLCRGLRLEMSLSNERQVIEKVGAKLQERRQKVLSLPRINPRYCTDTVLAMERFRGIPLSDVVSGKAVLTLSARKKLARSLLHELLIQVFELGLFHGDPHAGNLMLLPDETIGLFDWGLAGELKESDRKHIAAILKAVMILDVDRLVEALYELAQGSATKAVTRKKIRTEVLLLAKRLKPDADSGAGKASFCDQIEACLRSASKLGIHLPQGLLLMAKSLVTIEGLAKGIDPEVPLKRIASPVLLAAARPGLQELFTMTKNLPKIARRFFA